MKPCWADHDVCASKMDSTRLDQKPSAFFAEQFDERLITVHPIRDYRGRFNCDDDECMHYGKLRIDGGKFPFSFSMFFPATRSGVREKYIESAKSVLENLADLDARARQPADDDDIPDECDLDRDIYLAYVHVERDRVELQYFWDPFNAEMTAYFSRSKDGSWMFEGV